MKPEFNSGGSSTKSQKILVQAKDIGCIYTTGVNSVEALKSATCQIKMGDRIALVGKSGSGKSTLLQLLGGLEKPTSGHLDWTYFEEDKISPLRPLGISFIFQMPSLIPSLNVLENVSLPLLLANQQKNQSEELAFFQLMRLGIDNLKDKLPEELSGGQAGRVSAARALVCKPKLILADEPTGQLDQTTANHLMKVLLEASETEGISLLIATHDPNVVKHMDKVWEIEQGMLEVKE
ncbi:ABC transporter ATP-binding protein [Metabacillus sp. RGM 3146]|uniref:ABC transporter ATP-binding protein n=1 Tax=Metabacillus sp. RGM 3146 TaxID=3401092 RepID=UPI003B9A9795